MWCRYFMLVPSTQWGPETETRTLCTRILESTIKDSDRFQVGLTKIFFRAGLLARFEQLRTSRLAALATLMQKNVRRHLAVRDYKRQRVAIIGVQTAWRGVLARRKIEEERRNRAAVLIQSRARGFLERARYQRTMAMVVGLQSSELLDLSLDLLLAPVHLLTMCSAPSCSQLHVACVCEEHTRRSVSTRLPSSSRASFADGQSILPRNLVPYH